MVITFETKEQLDLFLRLATFETLEQLQQFEALLEFERSDDAHEDDFEITTALPF